MPVWEQGDEWKGKFSDEEIKANKLKKIRKKIAHDEQLKKLDNIPTSIELEQLYGKNTE